jgi:hypothetical protein
MQVTHCLSLVFVLLCKVFDEELLSYIKNKFC